MAVNLLGEVVDHPVAAPAAGAAAPAAEEKTEFDVVLAGFDAAAKIKVIKVSCAAPRAERCPRPR